MNPYRSNLVLINWGLAISLIALGYGRYEGWRQARGKPLLFHERVRNFVILFAVALNVAAVFRVATIPYWSVGSLLAEFWSISRLGWTAFGLWFLFDVPLRLARHYARSRPAPVITDSHPLDGVWSARTSFLDEIARNQAEASPLRVDPASGVDQILGVKVERTSPRPSPLERVGQLHSGPRSTSPAPDERPSS